jgi:fluoride ion exporter CrcB/FEX
MNPGSISYVVVALGGFLLAVMTFTTKGRRKEPWFRRALLMAGIFGILWGASSLILLQVPELIPERAWVSANNLKSAFGGAMIGLLMFMAGFKTFWQTAPVDEK